MSHFIYRLLRALSAGSEPCCREAGVEAKLQGVAGCRIAHSALNGNTLARQRCDLWLTCRCRRAIDRSGCVTVPLCNPVSPWT